MRPSRQAASRCSIPGHRATTTSPVQPIWLATTGGTTVTIKLTGLPPGVDMISHLHESGCAESGGDHFQFEKGGSVMPPNEVHLAFTPAADGTGFMTAENAETVGDDAVAIVVHPADLLDNKVACAEFSS